MNRGWIKLHRKLRESAIYNEGLVFLLIECLFSATHKDINIDYAGSEITLHAGQFVFGRHQWAKRLKINESTLYKRITKLNKYGIISVVNRNSSSGTIYQIEKWNEYQQEEQLSNSSVTAKEQLGNTNKNVKNYKNDKNNIYVDFIEYFNQSTKKRFKPNKNNLTNFDYWSKQYTQEQMKVAIKLALLDDWWKDKLTPERLLRQRNANGACDNIGDLLNKYEGKYELHNT